MSILQWASFSDANKIVGSNTVIYRWGSQATSSHILLSFTGEGVLRITLRIHGPQWEQTTLIIPRVCGSYWHCAQTNGDSTHILIILVDTLFKSKSFKQWNGVERLDLLSRMKQTKNGKKIIWIYKKPLKGINEFRKGSKIEDQYRKTTCMPITSSGQSEIEI